MKKDTKGQVDLVKIRASKEEVEKEQMAKNTNEQKTKQAKEQVSKVTKSDKMRLLYEDGMSVSEISRKLNVCYSFTYQVCQKLSNKKGNKRFNTNQPEVIRKADKFREDFDAGMSIGEIAKKYNTNYSYVWTIVDNYRKSKV